MGRLRMYLTEDEKALYAELVIQIAVFMAESSKGSDCEQGDHACIKGRVVDSFFNSDYENACGLLTDLGVMIPLRPDGTPHESKRASVNDYRIEFSAAEIQDWLMQNLPDTAPSLSAIIRSFLALMTGYGTHNLSTRRDKPVLPGNFKHAFELFAQCGYVERVGDAVEWTARIAPEMRAIHAWTDDDLSREELYDAEIKQMWRTMPPRFREVFFSGGPVDVISLSAAISQCWYDGRWQDTALDPDDPRISSLGRNIGKARDLAKKFGETGG